MKKLVFILIINALGVINCSFAQEREPVYSTINVKNVMLYENPTTSSSIVRRVFVGEVLKVIETIKNDQGEIWGKVYLTPHQAAFLQGVYFNNAGNVQQEVWQPEEVLRNKMCPAFLLIRLLTQ